MLLLLLTTALWRILSLIIGFVSRWHWRVICVCASVSGAKQCVRIKCGIVQVPTGELSSLIVVDVYRRLRRRCRRVHGRIYVCLLRACLIGFMMVCVYGHTHKFQFSVRVRCEREGSTWRSAEFRVTHTSCENTFVFYCASICFHKLYMAVKATNVMIPTPHQLCNIYATYRGWQLSFRCAAQK